MQPNLAEPLTEQPARTLYVCNVVIQHADDKSRILCVAECRSVEATLAVVKALLMSDTSAKQLMQLEVIRG